MESITDRHWPEEFSSDGNGHSNVSDVTHLGYSTTGASTSTLGFLHKIESHCTSFSLLPPSCTGGGDSRAASTSSNDLVNRYKSLIRQLPARSYVEKLVDIYFHNFNWQYDMLDRDIFDQQMEGWYKIPFGVFSNEGPSAIPPDLRVFPALLFQVVSIGMLVLPEKTDDKDREEAGMRNGHGERCGKEDKSDPSKETATLGDSAGVDFEALKYAGNMTFEDLATEYSESGVAIVSLLGKRQMTLTTVLTGFVRASFLKFVGMVPEAVSFFILP